MGSRLRPLLTAIIIFLESRVSSLNWLKRLSPQTRDNRGPRGCVDKIPTCHHFMVDYNGCDPGSEYYEYIEPNCRATCGLCTFDQEECGDKIAQEYCKFFDVNYSACNPISSYFYYVSANCRSFCRVCPYHGLVEFCEDFVSRADCEFFQELYDGCNPESTYHNYVSANCKKFCGICSPEENPVCLDTLTDPQDSRRSSEEVCGSLADQCGSWGPLGIVMMDRCRATCGSCTPNSSG